MVFNMTGNGDGLNFAVKQYTATPTGTAKENTIGVVTDTAITSWVMQAEQPTGAEGMVWIEVAAASDVAFYADKKQQVKLYPKSVKQYVDGAWSSVDAYVYQGGAWVEFSSSWNGELYYYGDEFESVTGGWIGRAGAAIGTHIIKGTDGITLKSSESANMQTANKIDLSGFNTLSVVVTDSTANWCYVGVTQNDEDYFNAGDTSANWPKTTPYVKIDGPVASFTANLDVSGVSGLYTVVIAIRSDTTSQKTMTVRSVKMDT